jgi:ferredoxin
MVDSHGIHATVDRAQCIGNGVCLALAPAAFTLDASMKAVVLDPGAESEEALLAAAESCPTQAIYLSIEGKALYP